MSLPHTPPSIVPSLTSRGYLPHVAASRVHLVGFRLADALPAAVLDAWNAELAAQPLFRRDLELSRRCELYVDRGHGASWLAREDIATIVADAIRFHDGKLYDALAWVLMPNHVHFAMRPRGGIEMSRALHAIKSYTAKQANRVLERTGTFWAHDYFDRFVRDGRHLEAALGYIAANPLRAGLDARFRRAPWMGKNEAACVAALAEMRGDSPVRAEGVPAGATH